MMTQEKQPTTYFRFSPEEPCHVSADATPDDSLLRVTFSGRLATDWPEVKGKVAWARINGCAVWSVEDGNMSGHPIGVVSCAIFDDGMNPIKKGEDLDEETFTDVMKSIQARTLLLAHILAEDALGKTGDDVTLVEYDVDSN